MQLARKGLVTGVGSLPYLEPGPALELIRTQAAEIPHWPQLPKAGEDEGFSIQYLQALVKLGMVKADSSLYFDLDSGDWLTAVTEFYEMYLGVQEKDPAYLERFAFPPAAARGYYAFMEDLEKRGTGDALYLKGQLSGPLTVGFQLKDPAKRASYYNPQLRDILVKNLASHGLWQVHALSRFGLPVIMTVDDPGLYAYGLSTHVTLERQEIITALNEIYQALKAEGALVATHVCAGMDWTVLFDSEVEIINFDAYEYFDSIKVYPEELKAFLQRGGVMSWGIVPTSQRLTETAESLISRFEGYLKELESRGISPDLVLKQSMYTPSCGTGTLDPETAERIYATLHGFGKLVEKL